MKNYKQILEAINRGIKLALDDFEDNEQNSSLSQHNDVINSEDVIKYHIDLMKEVVDLGLPSGTLWCKYNLGVNPNQLSNAKDWYGDYYAWGELKPNKPEFRWSTYKYAEHYTDLFEKECLTKYCNKPRQGYNQITKTWGFTDNLTKLLPEDDAAYQNKKLHNFKFHIPTKEQCEELINYTTLDSVYMYNNTDGYNNVPGLNGVVLKSKINGNKLFIPFAGYYEFDGQKNVDRLTYLWSSDICPFSPSAAWRLRAHSNETHMDDWADRYIGYPIRPVINL